ncbi:MAG: HDOD domain-containing protein [Vicinamibacterales bacterium]
MASDGLLVSRQPILDANRRVFGYQLRFHAMDLGAGQGGEAGNSTVPEALERGGLDLLTRGRPAFLRLPVTRLGPEVTQALPPGRVVVEVPCEDWATGVLADDCRAFREAGYAVALDNFTLSDETRPLLELANFAKLNYLPTPGESRKAAVDAARETETRIVAKHVEAPEVFDEARREGFTHFQGYFFERPGFHTGRPISADKLIYLQLLQALSNPNLSLAQVEDIVKRDAALSYRILRLVNSAGFAQAMHVASMRHALLLVGRDTVCRWASLAVIAGLGSAAPDELVVMTTVRARFCELLASRLGGVDATGQGFLVGLCSLLDVMLQQPMAAVLDDLPLAEDVRAALLGHDNQLRRLLECVVAYEKADWTGCLDLAGLLDLDPRTLAPAYVNALRWAHELQATAKG